MEQTTTEEVKTTGTAATTLKWHRRARLLLPNIASRMSRI
jgi:hypothetical protein